MPREADDRGDRSFEFRARAELARQQHDDRVKVRRGRVEQRKDGAEDEVNQRRDEQGEEPRPGEPGLADRIGGLAADAAQEPLHGQDAGQEQQQQRDGR